MKRPFLFFFVVIAIALSCPAFAEPVRKPNIVYILADDLGWTDLGCQGSVYYETPHIDRLAAQGIRFTNYHNCQNCQPTRAALMSGQYAPRTGVYTVGSIDRFDWQSRPLQPVPNRNTLPLDKVTLAQSLKNAGYVTALFGKWHLGETAEYHPKNRGFDEALVSMGRHFDFKTDPAVPVAKGKYLADFLTDRAVDFIERHKDAPFFLYVPHFGVHAPHEARAEWIDHFKAKTPGAGHRDPVYAAMIASVDESVGRILATLEKLHLEENTVVVFSSDNGGVGGYGREGGLIQTAASAGKRPPGATLNVTDNAPLRSGKGSLYEGGTRVPFVVRWPGMAKPGSVCATPAIHVDVYPTLLQLAGATPPPKQPLDGESLVALLRDPSAALRRQDIFQHFPGYLGSGKDLWRTTPVGVIQSGNWKLMEYFEDRHLELYDLSEDPGERHNLAQAMPEKAREMHARMLAWRRQIHAPMPVAHQPQTGADRTPATAPKGAKRRKGTER